MFFIHTALLLQFLSDLRIIISVKTKAVISAHSWTFPVQLKELSGSAEIRTCDLPLIASYFSKINNNDSTFTSNGKFKSRIDQTYWLNSDVYFLRHHIWRMNKVNQSTVYSDLSM